MRATKRAEASEPKVVLATSFKIPHIGGASVVIEMLAASLRRRGLLQALVTPSRAAYRCSARWAVSRVLRPDAATSLALRLMGDRLQRSVRDALAAADAPPVIHTHDPLATCAAARARHLGIPVVQTVHGPWSRENASVHGGRRPRSQATMESIEREAFAAVDLLVVVGSELANLVVQDFELERGRVVVVPNAVDVDALPSPAKAGREEPFLLVPRRLVPKNGVEFAIRAFARLGGARPRLVIAGDGPLRASLEALARQLGVTARVTFLGDVERPRLLSLMSGAAAVLVPSVPANGVVEPCGLVVLEGMASRVPVIASSIGGMTEMLAGGHGVGVPAGDADALAEAIRGVLEMPAQLRVELVEKARARVRAAYGIDAWMEKMLAVYHTALERRAA